MKGRVYLDHHAATPLAPGVREAMDDAHRLAWGNPSSAHAEGRAARAVLEEARRAVALALDASPADVVFTGGGTEACNLGVLGLGVLGLGVLGLGVRGLAADPRGLTVVTSTIEHPAVERAVAALAEGGAQVHALPLHADDGRHALRGLLAREDLEPSRVLLAVQAASHETGSVLDVSAIARLVPEGVRGFVDASQALGKLPLASWAPPGWAIAISGAKLGASAGSGALLVPRGSDVLPRMLGGAQERGRRAGTLDVAAISGLGVACARVNDRLAAMERVAARRDRLERALTALGAVVNGALGGRLATVTNVSFRGWRSATLVAALDLEGVSASAGAACSSGVEAPSPVVRALHPGEPWRAESCVRLSLGPETTDGEITAAIAAFERVLARRPA